MLYKITYAEGRCHNYAHSRKDLLEWLELLKDEVITEIKKIAKNGKTEIVTDRYQKIYQEATIVTAEEYINEARSIHGAAAEIARTVTGMVFPEFSSEPMTVKDASDLTGLTQTAIRAGILNGWLPIGVAVRDGKQVSGNSEGKANFIIFPRKVWEVTGHIWRGRHESKND